MAIDWNAQKDAIAAYLAVYQTQVENDPEFDDFSLYFPMYKAAIDGMNDAGMTSAEVDFIITYRAELLKKLTA